MKRMIIFLAALAAVLALPGTALAADGGEAPERAEEYVCHIEGAGADAAHTALLQKKGAELQGELGVKALAQMPNRDQVALLPSVGEVNLLVIPIAYPDHPELLQGFDRERTAEEFFAPYAPEETEISAQSVRGFYHWASYGRLELTGEVLEPYAAPQTSDYYYGEKRVELERAAGLVKAALEYYMEQGVDLSRYDNDGDGILDGIFIRSLRRYPVHSTYLPWGNAEVGKYKMQGFVFSSFWSDLMTGREDFDGEREVAEHELGHLMGLLDNYEGEGHNELDIDLGELMEGSLLLGSIYINAYYRYLLGWIEPLILTEEDTVDDVTLLPAEAYTGEGEEGTRAVVFIPHPAEFPFTEFYFAEYRGGGATPKASPVIYDRCPGVVIWHANTFLNNYGSYSALTNYLKPVYKSGTEEYGEKDIYVAGDAFSPDTAPGSGFYDGTYTGIYLKVKELTPGKAVLRAGFKDRNRFPGPVIEFSGPSKQAIHQGDLAKITITIKTESGDLVPEEDIPPKMKGMPYQVCRWGQVNDVWVSGNLQGTNPYTLQIGGDYHYTFGDGAIWLEAPEGLFRYNGKDSKKTASEKVYIDNTPPKIVLRGEEPQAMWQGTPYVELGAVVSDNLDPHIEDKLQIDTSALKTEVPGVYNVVYSLTDHAGNTAREVRRVVVETPTASHFHQYSSAWSGSALEHWHGCRCGEKRDVAAHVEDDGTVTKEPTFEEEGVKVFFCAICGYKMREEMLDKLFVPHEHDFSTEWLADDTEHWRECSVCHTRKDAASHTEDGGVFTIRPTLTSRGMIVFSCTVCGRRTRTEYTPKLDPSHTHEYSADWKSDRANHWRECECGERGEFFEHSPEADAAVDPTCTTPGKTAGSHCSECGYVLAEQKELPARGHIYSDMWWSDGSNHWHACSRCLKEPKDIAPHVEDEGTIKIPPTVTSKGIIIFSCKICGLRLRTEYIPMLPPHVHEYSADWKKDETGHWHECGCGERAEETAHTPVEDAAVEPACTTPGKTEGSHCSECGYVLAPQKELPAKGHSYAEGWSQDDTDHWRECTECGDKTDMAPHVEDKGTVTKRPTEEETGVRTFSCSVCGRKLREESIDKLEPAHTHEYSTDWKKDESGHWHECGCGERAEETAHAPETDKAVEATCTTPGKTGGSHCSECGYVLVPQKELPAKGHSYAEGWSQDDTDHWRECTECGGKTDMAPHVEDKGTVTKRPTEEETGVRTFSCSVCGRKLREEEIEKLPAVHIHEYPADWKSDENSHWHECECEERAELAPHIWDNGEVTKEPTDAQEGTRTYTCTVCGRTRTEDIPATGGGSSSGGGNSGGETTYAVSVPSALRGGKVKAEPRRAGKGKTVTLTAEAADGYTLETLTVKDRKGNSLSLTRGEGDSYTFTMPASRVTVEAEFGPKAAGVEKPQGPEPVEPEKPVLPFTDVKESAWYYDTVAEAYRTGLMTGATETLFLPESAADRGMVVTILHRLEGQPAASGNSFSDVSEDAYYAGAVAWAVEQGIVNGYENGAFRPEKPVTREELAAILYRYGRYQGRDMTERTALSGYVDAEQVSGYAWEPLSWAVGAGLISGTDWGGLYPGGSATRAELAAILLRYCKN